MNKYLEKIALNRLVAELAKGTVKTPLENLVAKGVLRSGNRYIDGMKRGNQALAKKIGVNVTKVKDPDTFHGMIAATSGGAATVPSPRGSDVLFAPKHITGGKHTKELSIRHELFEARELKNQVRPEPRKIFGGLADQPALKNVYFQKLQKNLQKNMRRYDVPVSPVEVSHFANANGIVGAHANPSILSQESEVVRKNPYLKNSYLHTYRKTGGEGALVRNATGKRYGMDKMTGSDHTKMRNLTPSGSKSDPSVAKVNTFNVPPVSRLHISKYIKEYNPER